VTPRASLLITLLLTGGLALSTLGHADDAALVARSLVSRGDLGRVQNVLARARRGEKVVVSVIGGSITQGAKASKPELNYGSLIAKWWRETFPQAQVEFVNAGIGATGSNYAALRARRDLLSKQPDFVVVEFGVNDPNTQQAAETYEGLLRQILKQPQQPAAVLMFMMHRNGGNAQEWQSKVGAHYALPMVSFRDALWPEIEAGRIPWEDVEADEVHPNDRGHAYAAQFVTALLEDAGTREHGNAGATATTLPAALLTDRYEHTALFEAGALQPVTNEGWTYEAGHGWDARWQSSQPGNVVEFEVEGTAVFFMEWHIRGPMGKARVQVDDQPPLVIDAWFDQTWGGYRLTRELARDLPPGRHRVRVELLAEKNANSEGHEFRIMGLGAAGTTE